MSGARKPLLVFPCNGNGIEALDCLGDEYEVIGFVDDTPEKQTRGAFGIPVWPRSVLHERRDAAVLAVPGGPQTFAGRRAIIEGLGIEPERFARVIHPTARVSRLASIGTNVLIMAGVVVTSNATIGNHVCVLPNTVIHHDAIIGDWTLVGTAITVAGGAAIGENSYIGSGSNIRNGVRIGRGSLVGLGSNVVKDVAEGSVVAGNPARPLPQRI